MSSERTERMRLELESMDIRLEDERKRSAELLEQVFPLFILKLFTLYLLNGALQFTANLAFTGQYAAEVSSEAKRGAGESCSSGATGTTDHALTG